MFTSMWLYDNFQLMVATFMAKMKSDKHPTPVKPTVEHLTPEIRVLRAKLMLEECLETINKGLGVKVEVRDVLGIDLQKGTLASTVITDARLNFECVEPPDLVELADGIADCRVVNEGTAITAGIAMKHVYDIVMDNNMAKFGPGHSFREDGKLIKPPDHVAPSEDIACELLSQGCNSLLLKKTLCY